MKNIMRKFLIVATLALCLIPHISFASEMSFSGEKNKFSTNEEFVLHVIINTEDLKVNALEGDVIFPDQVLELKEVQDGNSSVNFWIERPKAVSPGDVRFSGITAGGFSGPDRLIFTLVFKAKTVGSGSIAINNVQVLQNDGQGTKINDQEKPFLFSVAQGNGPTTQENLSLKDTGAPEDFVPFVGQDSSIFDGKYFLAFSTVDKGSGINGYFVGEKFWPFGAVVYNPAVSPYLLQDQSLKSKIYVKAVDNNGNARVVSIPAQNKLGILEQFLLFAILLSICIFIAKKIRQRFARS